MNRWICMIIFMIWSNDNDYSDYWWRFFFYLHIQIIILFITHCDKDISDTFRSQGWEAGASRRWQPNIYGSARCHTRRSPEMCTLETRWTQKHTHLRLYGTGTLVHVKRTWKRTWKPIRVKCMDFRPVSRTAVNLVISVNLSTLKKNLSREMNNIHFISVHSMSLYHTIVSRLSWHPWHLFISLWEVEGKSRGEVVTDLPKDRFKMSIKCQWNETYETENNRKQPNMSTGQRFPGSLFHITIITSALKVTWFMKFLLVYDVPLFLSALAHKKSNCSVESCWIQIINYFHQFLTVCHLLCTSKCPLHATVQKCTFLCLLVLSEMSWVSCSPKRVMKSSKQVSA